MRTFLLLLLIQTIGSQSHQCPHHCTCKLVGAQAEWLRAKCGDHIQEIRDIDLLTISVELVQLDLSKNNIYVIEENIFQNLTNLRRLDLSGNKITSIEEESFAGLGNLERLNLSQNEISTIDTNAFKRIPNIKKLDLSGNKVHTLVPSLFHDLLALDRLKLNGNALTTLKEGIFHGLKFLKQLDLSNNPWKCDCELYWFSNWIHNTSIKLNVQPKCAAPPDIKGQLVKKLRLTDNFQCQWKTPAIEIKPEQNQVIFAGDSITLKCRAPSITDDTGARLSWLWYPNTTAENSDLSTYSNPEKSLPNIKIENRYLSDSGIVDSSLNIDSVVDEHNGQWNCLLVSMHGNRSKAISIIVISDQTQYCPLAVTKNNKGIYTWPRTVIGWKAELPCEGNRLSGLLQLPLKASYQCDLNGQWQSLNTEPCPYISHTTKVLEQFSKVNLSLTKGTLLETAKRFRNYTADGAELADAVEVNFITQTIENYLSFLVEEKELGTVLIDVVNAVMNLSKEVLQTAENSFKSCRRLIKAVETISEFTPFIQSHKRNMAVEEHRFRRDSFNGLSCTWYTSTDSGSDMDPRLLRCTTNNRTIPTNTKNEIIEASIQLPATLLQHIQGVATHQLMISMYSDNKLFPRAVDDNMDISTCIIGSKLIGVTVQNLSDPVFVMLRAPFHQYSGRKPQPVVWDDTLNESGGWTSDGCRLSNLFNNLIVFQCNRLGYYGLLQDVTYLNQDANRSGAKFRFSNPGIYIGSFVVITCLAFTSVTYIICFSSISMPKKSKHSAVNTWLAMTLLSFLYTIGIQQTENVEICEGVGLVLHYLSLCCLLWMAVSASNMYKKLSKTNRDVLPDDELADQPLPKPLLGLYLVGWGIALIICGISGAINLREYAGYSHCFLTSAPALAALFVPAIILVLYLAIFYLLIRCTLRNADLNAQLSEGTQATENMDLELLEPNANVGGDRNSIHSAQTGSSEAEDGEHSLIMQLKGQIITLILYLISWSTAAAVTVKPLNLHISFEETLFATLYAISASCLGIFVLLFYGVARNDVRSQWLMMRCWLRQRKNRCCRTRSVSDANPAIPTQPLVQNLGPPLSNSQATQVTSDTNSVASSRHTNRSQNCNRSKNAEIISNQDTLPIGTKMGNVNLVVLHRQQYRSNNSVTTYTEPSTACVEMFYNPHQSGVARKFFKKQRRHTKNNNLGPRKQGDGGATSDGGSCISIPRPAAKVDNDVDRNILTSSAKVNNTNIHVELNPISDAKNVNILSDSGGSMSEERTIPIRFVIGQETVVRKAKKLNNDLATLQEDASAMNATITATRAAQKLQTNGVSHESDPDTRTDEEKHLKNVSQQCSLEYSSEIESTTQMTSERSDHNLSEIGEVEEGVQEQNCQCPSANELSDIEEPQSRGLAWSYHSNSMYCLPLDHAKPLRNSYRSSLNDIASLTSSKNCEYSRPSLTDLQSTTSSNLYDRVPESRQVVSQSDQSLSEINSLNSDNAYALDVMYNESLTNINPAPNICDENFQVIKDLYFNNMEENSAEENITEDSLETRCLSDVASINSTENVGQKSVPIDDVSDACNDINIGDTLVNKDNEMFLEDSANHSLLTKKETSV